MDGQHHILSVLVENKFGVLSRIAGLFARRGYNIYSLAVSPTEDDRYSRMTVVVDGDADLVEQITKQLNKLIPVIKISELADSDAVERELMLVTIKGGADSASTTIVIRLIRSSSVGLTASEKMLNARRENSPATRDSTPGLFSTNTDRMWCLNPAFTGSPRPGDRGWTAR